jgi:hypothetical protein
MSLVSPTMKELSQSPASLGLLYPLSNEKVEPPVDIALDAWYKLQDDVRAPVRSVAMVDAADDGFVIVVIDTVANLPRWRISVSGHELAGFYRGMLGEPDAPSRGTLIVSAPRPCPDNATEVPKDTDPREPPDVLTLLHARLYLRVAKASRVVIGDRDAAFLQVP